MNDSTRTRLVRGALVMGGVMIVSGATLFASFSTIGRLRHDRAILEWNTHFGSLEDLLARHPPRDANASALRLEELSATFGIDLVPAAISGRPRPDELEAGAHMSVKDALGAHLRQQLESPALDPLPVPPRVATFLEDNDVLLRKLRDTLLAGDEPRWELKLAQGPGNPVPNLLGHLMLQEILLTEALERSRAGDDVDAVAWAEASWRLNGALRGDPVQITQMIAMSITSLQAGALRRLAHVPVEWEDRATDLSFRKTVQQALHGEIRYWSVGSTSIIEHDAGYFRSAVIAVATPYLRMCLADITEVSLDHMVDLDQADYLCPRDGDSRNEQVDFARWNVLAPLILPNFSAIMDRVARLELDLELTAKILAMKAAREDNPTWRDGLTSDRSDACPDDEWIYESSPGAGVTIRFSREIGWPDNSNVFLPSSYIAN